MTQGFGDLRRRALSALVLAPVALISLWLGGVTWVLLVMLAGIASGREWARVCRFLPFGPPGLLLPLLVPVAGAAAAFGFGFLALAVLAVVAALLAAGNGGGVGPRRWLAGGLFYLGLAAVAVVRLRLYGPAGLGNMLFVVLIVWASDSGAYLAGRVIGGAKLVPRISPSKTWAGAAGGLGFAILAGLLVAEGFAAGPSAGVLLASVTLGVASQAGDLLESVFKRRFGVKDSGSLIPGHGGVLDRLDGVLAAAPAAAILTLALGPGVELWR
ncbi:MAG TPA: phosphatidate cytidylyltransferase [Acetobacteraceae bacterium]|nr:phosphatidate cytidylyltransferase [Acetobacteraceae bacterium]